MAEETAVDGVEPLTPYEWAKPLPRCCNPERTLQLASQGWFTTISRFTVADVRGDGPEVEGRSNRESNGNVDRPFTEREVAQLIVTAEKRGTPTALSAAKVFRAGARRWATPCPPLMTATATAAIVTSQ